MDHYGRSPLSHALIAACNLSEVVYSLTAAKDTNEDSEGRQETTHPSEAGNRAKLKGVIDILDCIASILVSEGTDEAIAVGASFPGPKDSPVEIFIASNGNKNLDSMGSAFKEIWDCLVQMRLRRSDDSDISEWSHEDAFSNWRALRTLVYRHNVGKLAKRFGHADTNGINRMMEEVLREGSSYVVDEPKMGDMCYVYRSELEEFDFLKDTVDAVSDINDALGVLNRAAEMEAKACIANLEGAGFVDLMAETFTSVGRILDELFNIVGWRAHVLSIALSRLGAFSSDGSNPGHDFFDRCDGILSKSAQINEEPIPAPGTFRRFFDKVYKTERCIATMVVMSRTEGFGRIFDRGLRVTIVRADRAPLEYNLLNDPEICRIVDNVWDFKEYEHELASRLAERKEQVTHCRSEELPHCECTLLAFFAHNSADIEPYGYIGTSKSPCTGCSLFFKSYNEAAKTYVSKPFLIRGSQSKKTRFVPWVKPMLHDDALSDMTERHLCEEAENKFAALLTHHIDKEVIAERSTPSATPHSS